MRLAFIKYSLSTALFFIVLGKAYAQENEFIRKPSQFPRLFSISLQAIQPGSLKTVSKTNTSTLFVYIFLSPECPVCRYYLPELNRLQQLYKDNMVIRGIFPGRAYSAEKIQKFRDEYHISFPLFIDTAKTLVNYLSASVTPEAMLFTKDAKRVYTGAVDDWLKELGEMRVKPSKFYLADAIAATLQGKKPDVPVTTAKGCLINDL